MDKQTISVSKGCFVFKNGPKRLKKKRKNSGAEISEPWYPAYKKTKQSIISEIEEIQSATFTKVKNNLIYFVQNSRNGSDNKSLNNLPTAVLLTGINQGDHYKFFDTFTKEIRAKLKTPVAAIQARNCLALKSAIETMVFGLISEYRPEMNEDDDIDSIGIRRSQYNVQVLKSWYDETFGSSRPILTLVVPDFELFRNDVLLEFMQLLLTMTDALPIALVLGIATDKTTLHRTLPYCIINKLKLSVFQSNPSRQCLNKILNDVILSPKVSVNLSGNVLNLLADIFLFFDFSINSFLHGYQYCILEHYSQSTALSLCNTKFCDSIEMIKTLNHDDVEQIRQLHSFRSYVESLKNPREIIALLTDDKHFVKQLKSFLKDIYQYFSKFHCFLRFLMAMLQQLPKNVVAKQLRDAYSLCATSDVFSSTEFDDTWQLLSLLSKEEFLKTLNEAVDSLKQYKEGFCSEKGDIIGCETGITIDEVVRDLKKQMSRISSADLNFTENINDSAPLELTKNYKEELKNKLLNNAAKSKTTSELKHQIQKTLTYIRNELEEHLRPFVKAPPLHELFVFSDVKSIRQHIVGSPRAAVHTALQNPQLYLQCECCTLDDPTKMLATLPDISVVFKLHLESGHMINLFDWMQAFNIIVQDESADNESDEIQPDIQARFTRAVAELQFLGYIKTSKRKTDHVARLTW